MIELRVRQLRWEADDVVSVTLAAPCGTQLPSWEPGAHVDLRTPAGVRQYSLCGDPRRHDEWRVAVYREPGGRGGSQWVHDTLRVGDLVAAGTPRNAFPLVPAARYLFVGGGIGVTPLRPMIDQAERSGVPWTLVYGGRRRSSMAFLDELGEYGDRVRIRPEDEYGRLDPAAELDGMAAELDRVATGPGGAVTGRDGPARGTAVYCCGPPGLIAAVEQHCRTWPTGTFHAERFTPAALTDPAPDTAFDVELARSGVTLHVPAGTSILDAVERAGLADVGSCYQGTCGSCETKVLAGRPDHRDSVLSAAERASGTSMMLCVSRCASSRLVLDL
ncbi:ferredoxin-NADP reductase [Streptosporangium becharense]|uniref:Ferredoxin-NADP reductase n=1 Tax=Streptosporangium becharense TaxID=1816182 RepID=A0A7W9MHG0_9ACTN|nr:PDR/VanB family oxidoreductase [Streptosporangium becharense]MBB2912748.1 ferredoxin-NADP reductase [Streptosporangium becharense]MBB5820423.1 ferredoxin-NADP reductase [Streptosporangium becharense]